MPPPNDAYATATNDTQTIVKNTQMVHAPDARAIVALTHTDLALGTTLDMDYTIPVDPANPGTELLDFISAIVDPIPNETGVGVRRFHYRVLMKLSSLGRLPGFAIVP